MNKTMPETNKKLVWRNLLKYQCPDCFSQLEAVLNPHIGVTQHKCTICEFKIGIDKFESMVDSMRRSRPRRPYTEEEDNLSKLNNL